MQRTIYSLLIAIVLLAGQPAGAYIPVEGAACDFVTGGGWIRGSGTSSLAAGAKANFGVGGGVKHGAFWGHLQYNDHSTSPPKQVHGTSVTGYALGPNPNDRVIIGTARVNGVDGFTYTVAVTDNDEPGRHVDEFSITLMHGDPPYEVYAAGTNYGDGPIAGGNIQLHKRNPSNTPPEGVICPP